MVGIRQVDLGGGMRVVDGDRSISAAAIAVPVFEDAMCPDGSPHQLRRGEDRPWGRSCVCSLGRS
jgi:hypothetical protein